MRGSNKYFIPAVSGAVLLGLIMVTTAIYKNYSMVQATTFVLTYTIVTAAAIYDYWFMKIPNILPLTLFAARGVIFGIELTIGSDVLAEVFNSVLGCVLAVIILLAASKLSRGGVGGGDVKLLAAMGFACGFETVFSVLLAALVICSIAGGILMASKKKTSKDELPFAPFIWCGFVLITFLSLV